MKYLLICVAVFCITGGSDGIIFNKPFLRNLFKSGVLDVNILRCIVQNTNVCPHPDVNFRMFTPKGPRFGVELNIKSPWALYQAGYNKHRESVVVIHGFNGTAQDKHLAYLRDAYLHRDYNVVTVDWKPLTQYPCYLSALINTRITAQCTAQIYSFLTHHGTPREKITCVGHSLGAHVCGMISNHLTKKQYRIIGLDPARPLIERKKDDNFRLTLDDANVIQVIHTNAGYLGQAENTGHLNYCINGGKYQPYCRGHPIRRSRCSHFLSICFLANAIFKHKKFLGVPCPNGCTEVSGPGRLPVSTRNPFEIESLLQEFRLGQDAPDNASGCYCLDVPFAKHCPFSEIG